MQLNLNKPIVFFDLEATGLDITHDRIVEISILRVNVDGSEETYTTKVNPTIPISKRAQHIHGISNEDVKDCKTFSDIANDIARRIEGCDLAGYNSNRFDIPMLAEEFLRAEVEIDLEKRSFVDVQVIYHKMEQRTLSAAYKFYCKKEIENAHSAEADTIATYEVLKAQLDCYDELENNVEKLAKISSYSKHADFAGRITFNDKKVEVFNFGKYKGQEVEAVFAKDTGYYSWIMNSDFPLYTKRVFTNIKLRMFGK